MRVASLAAAHRAVETARETQHFQVVAGLGRAGMGIAIAPDMRPSRRPQNEGETPMFRTIRRFLVQFASRLSATSVAGVLAFLAVLLSASGASALAQRAGDFELEIDAPWRMEPRGSQRAYGTIPIQISIHDADQPATLADQVLQKVIHVKQQGHSELDAALTFVFDAVRSVMGPVTGAIADALGINLFPFKDLKILTLNQFRRLEVYEEVGGNFVLRQTFTLANIHEVERTIGLWQYAANQSGPETPFAPPARPSYALCRRWQGQSCTAFASLRPTSEWNLTAMYQPTDTTPGHDVRLRAVLVVSAVEGGVATTKTFERVISVHLGEEPLPKFDSDRADWAYGDLHYHSQGTDNDGESGYAYRGVLQAMGAMGLDFAFATDHASNSPQIGSAAPKLSFELVDPITRGLRDLSPDRFAFDLGLLNDATGGNRQVTSSPRVTGDGRLVAPQLFLGSEVDVMPEFETGTQSGIEACNDVPKLLKVLDQKKIPIAGQFIGLDDYWCDTMSQPVAGNRSLLYDVQGPESGRLLSSRFYGRQHLLHLPVDGTNARAFIPSNTSKYGGATRRLGEILDVELAQRRKGYIFLAHPFQHEEGDGMNRLGPDLWPYSPAQLEDAFASPYVLGLQIWNEDPLRAAKLNERQPFDAPDWQTQSQPFHAYDVQYWDILQLYGLDKARTSKLTWLPSGQPRRVFMAGGSDAHGDLNYRRKGFFLGSTDATDTAMGTPRNLVNVGTPNGTSISGATGSGQPVSQSQVIDGLRSGNFAVTDGPAVRVAIDLNGNGVIDASDTLMGGVRTQPTGPFKVIVEWLSTPEFAPVQDVDVMLGVWADGLLDGMVYTRSYDGPIANASNTYVQPGTGRKFVKTPNWPYWYDPTNGKLRITVGAGEGYAGRRVLTIDPNDFPVGRDACILSEPAMKPMIAGGTTTTVPTSGGTVVYLNQSLKVVLNDMANGTFDPPPQCIRREFQSARRPDRVFVRAEVRNNLLPGSTALCVSYIDESIPQCVYRQAFSNPVWVNLMTCSTPGCIDLAAGLDPAAAIGTASKDGGGTVGTIPVSRALTTGALLTPVPATTTPTPSPTTTLSRTTLTLVR